MKKMIIIAVVFMVTLAPTIASAEVAKDEQIIADALFVRPFGIVAIGVGTVVFIVSTPITIFTGDATRVAKEMIADPFTYTFKRPLGNFEYEPDMYWQNERKGY